MPQYEKIFQQLKQKHKFFIRGLHLEPYESENAYVSLLYPYYKEKENFVFLALPFSGRCSAVLELFSLIESQKKVIVSSTLPLSSSPETVRPESFSYEEDWDHVLCDNFFADPKLFKGHVSFFIDYSRLPDIVTVPGSLPMFSTKNSDWYKAALSSLCTADTPDLSLICSPPPPQSVEFVFTTSDSLKSLALAQLGYKENTIVYVHAPDSASFTSQNDEVWHKYTRVSAVPRPLRCSRFIFFDILLDSLCYVLDRVAEVHIFYSTQDFPKIRELVLCLDSRGITVPDHIRKIAEKY